jgi:hypothetical protein
MIPIKSHKGKMFSVYKKYFIKSGETPPQKNFSKPPSAANQYFPL